MRVQNFKLTVHRDGTFSVVASYLPGSDEMWEIVEHPARFRDEERATRFLEHVSACRHKFHLSEWMVEGHVCSPMKSDHNPAPYCVVDFNKEKA